MSLRQLAESDLNAILEDSVTGFGWAITVTNPDGVTDTLTGASNDIAQAIDPDTGQIVSGRAVTVVLRTSSLVAAGLGQPQGIADASKKPWIVAFDDIGGTNLTFKIMGANPDRTLGLVSCILEAYKP